jgi:hypothetical protein
LLLDEDELLRAINGEELEVEVGTLVIFDGRADLGGAWKFCPLLIKASHRLC